MLLILPLLFLLGRFRNDDGSGKENVTWKSIFAQLLHLFHILQCWRGMLQLNQWARCWIKCRELKIYGCMIKLSSKPQMQKFHDVILPTIARGFFKVRAAHAARLFSSFDQSNSSFEALPLPCASSVLKLSIAFNSCVGPQMSSWPQMIPKLARKWFSNSPFSNYLWPPLQSESWSSSINMKISSHLHVNKNYYSYEREKHQDSLWKRGQR